MGRALCEDTSLWSISPPCEFFPFPTFDQEVASDPLGAAGGDVSVSQGRGGRAAGSLWIFLSLGKTLKKTHRRFERSERKKSQRKCLEEVRATRAFLSLPPNGKWRPVGGGEQRDPRPLVPVLVPIADNQ